MMYAVDPICDYIADKVCVDYIRRDSRGGAFFIQYTVITPDLTFEIPLWPWTNWKKKVDKVLDNKIGD